MPQGPCHPDAHPPQPLLSPGPGMEQASGDLCHPPHPSTLGSGDPCVTPPSTQTPSFPIPPPRTPPPRGPPHCPRDPSCCQRHPAIRVPPPASPPTPGPGTDPGVQLPPRPQPPQPPFLGCVGPPWVLGGGSSKGSLGWVVGWSRGSPPDTPPPLSPGCPWRGGCQAHRGGRHPSRAPWRARASGGPREASTAASGFRRPRKRRGVAESFPLRRPGLILRPPLPPWRKKGGGGEMGSRPLGAPVHPTAHPPTQGPGYPGGPCCLGDPPPNPLTHPPPPKGPTAL